MLVDLELPLTDAPAPDIITGAEWDTLTAIIGGADAEEMEQTTIVVDAMGAPAHINATNSTL